MTHFTRNLVLACLALLTLSDAALAQRRGGGGRGGGRGGGGFRGGGGRGGGGFRGGGGGISRGNIARPNMARPSVGARPNVSNLTRPSNPIAGRGNYGNINRGNINRGNINTGNINTGNINRGYGWDNDYGCCNGRGVAWAAGAVTGAAVSNYNNYPYYGGYSSSAVYTLPSGCVTTVVNGVSYQQCGSTYYQQSFVGDNVSYVPVSPP